MSVTTQTPLGAPDEPLGPSDDVRHPAPGTATSGCDCGERVSGRGAALPGLQVVGPDAEDVVMASADVSARLAPPAQKTPTHDVLAPTAPTAPTAAPAPPAEPEAAPAVSTADPEQHPHAADDAESLDAPAGRGARVRAGRGTVVQAAAGWGGALVVGGLGWAAVLGVVAQVVR